MYTIRQAHINDVPVLALMGEKFYQYSEFHKFVPYDPESAASKLAQLILTGFLYVAEHDEDGIVAGLAGTMTTLWFNANLPVASELAWWVEEKHRKSPVGIRLYKAFEKWAYERGVYTVIMSDLIIDDNAPAEKLFKKLGFSVVERGHIKRG
jgi:GNAT superfamily N-acetyltransferase